MVVEKKSNKPTGRPIKLTPTMQSELAELIKAGNYVEVACDLAGIHRSTYYDWMKKARASKRANRYTAFSDTIKKAHAFSEARDVALIARAGEKHWQAAAWRLERKYPDRWGKQKMEIQHSGKVEADVSHIADTDREVIKCALDFVAQTAKQTVEYDENSEDDFT